MVIFLVLNLFGTHFHIFRLFATTALNSSHIHTLSNKHTYMYMLWHARNVDGCRKCQAQTSYKMENNKNQLLACSRISFGSPLFPLSLCLS